MRIFTFIVLITLFNNIVDAQQDTLKHELDEISILGESKQEIVLEIPSAVNYIDLEKIQYKGLSLQDVISRTPGINIKSRSGGPLSKITIRGNGYRSNAPQTVGIRVMIDGIPETEPDGRTSLDMVDLSAISRVEVIKTNSTPLFGVNSGGVINLLTNTNFKKSFANARTLFGSFGLKRYELKSGFILGKTNVLFSLANTNFDGWRDHSMSFSSYFNLTAVSRPGDRSKLYVTTSGVSSFYQIAGPLTLAQLNSDRTQANTTYLQRDQRRHQKLFKFGFNYEKGFDGGHFVSVTGFAFPKNIMRSQKGDYRNFTRHHIGGKLQYSNIMDFGEDVSNHISAGIDNQYQSGASLFYTLSSDNNRGDSLEQNKNEGAHNYGAYIREELTLDNLSIVLGARYNISDYDYEDYKNQELSVSKTFERFTPSIGLSYFLTPTNTVYANYSKGTENPAFNEVKAQPGYDTLFRMNPLLQPAESHTFEGGTKGLFLFDNTMLSDFVYTLTGFYILGKNELIPFSSQGSNYYINAGNTSKTGVEVSFKFSSVYGINLSGAYTFIQQKFLENPEGYSLNVEGNTVPGIPLHLFNGLLEYNSSFGLYVSLGVEHTGEMWINNINTVENRSSTILNTDLNYRKELGSFVFNIFTGIENITDEKYVSTVFVNDLDGEYYQPGLPRNYYGGLSIKYNF